MYLQNFHLFSICFSRGSQVSPVGALVGSYISCTLIGTLGVHSTPCSSAIFSRYTCTSYAEGGTTEKTASGFHGNTLTVTLSVHLVTTSAIPPVAWIISPPP